MTRITLARRIIVAFAFGLIATILAFLEFTHWNIFAGDFTWSWRAAQALLANQNPYAVIQPTGIYPYDAPFYYPLPAALIALPFALFPATLAGALFVGCSAAALAWALVRQSPSWLILFCSAPYFMALRYGQWSPLLTAAMLLPALTPLAVVKPNLGLGILALRPTWWAVVGGGGLLLASFVVCPTWLADWLQALAFNRHTAPILTFPGCFMLLTLLRWRDPHARFVLALAILPQRLIFYDQLPLLLVAQTNRQRQVLVLCSWVGFLSWQLVSGPYTEAAPSWVLWSCYLPALVVVLAPLRQQLRQLATRD
jgi:hypothetical protein